MRLAWVTGARGFLGRHVARHLQTEGWQVAGIGHGEWKAEEAEAWGLASWRRAEVAVSELRDLAAASGPPELIFHAAGSGSVGFSLEQPLADFERTVVTTAAVLEAMRTIAPAARLVYPSSAAVYGVTANSPIAETSPVAPVSPYGAHKAMAEHLCLTRAGQLGLRCAIVRYFSVYGPGLRKQILWDLVQKIAADPAELLLHGTGEETRDFLHVEDAARLVSLLAKTVRDESLVVNGGSGHAVSIRELAHLVAAELGEKPTIRFSGERRLGDPAFYCADTGRLVQLGFVPSWTLRAGVRDYLASLRKSETGAGENR